MFTEDNHHEWAFVCGPTTSPNKSKLADSGHIEFRKVLTSPYWMKILIWYKDATGPSTNAHATKNGTGS